MLAARLLVLAASLWLIALLAAPAALRSPHPFLVGAAAVVYNAGSLVCHQRPERSFAIQGRAMPVCARCSGLYGSAAAGGILALFAAARAHLWRAMARPRRSRFAAKTGLLNAELGSNSAI